MTGSATHQPRKIQNTSLPGSPPLRAVSFTFAPTRRWVIFFMASLLFVLSQFYRASVAVITPDLIRELGLDTRGLSIISASFFYAFALTQIPIGMYLDTIGPRISMTALSLLGAAGALVFASGNSTEALVAGVRSWDLNCGVP